MIVYDSSNRDRIAITAWRVMVSELRDFRELILSLILRNVSAQFRQSFLGYVWIVLPPVATTLIFTLLRESGIFQVPMAEGAMPYALFALLGTTLWQFFTQVTMSATGSIASAGNLVSKVYFPREVLVLSAVGNSFINLLVRSLVLAISFLVLGFTPHWQTVFAPLLLVPMALLGVGIGMFFAPLNTMMHDTSRLLEFGFQFGMFLAPTIYPTPPLASTGWQSVLYWMHTFNPVSHFMHAIQDLITHGRFVFDPGLQVSVILSMLAFLCGWRFFHICEPLLAERL